MQCPECKEPLQPWLNSTGVGYRGIWCRTCNKHWWSTSVANAIRAAELRILNEVMSASFPLDAEDDTTKELEHDDCMESCDACDRTFRALRELRKS